MVIQDQQLTELSKHRQQLIRDIDKEEDVVKRAVLVGKLVIIERDIENIRSQSLSTTISQSLTESSGAESNNTHHKATRTESSSPVVDMPRDVNQAQHTDELEHLEADGTSATKIKTTKIKGNIKQNTAKELIVILIEKGFDKDQQRKILSNAYQQIYKNKEVK